jgi:CDP-diacylglycerol--serine O-phosphatidyltransferase
MPRRRHPAWIVLPTSLTLANALCGFAAMQFLIAGESSSARGAAGWLILAGWMLDLVDGPAARWAQATGAFGREMDALSDVLTFGAATALLLTRTGALGAVAAAALLLCGVSLRLARFAAAADDGPHLWFAGLPSSGSAALVASLAVFDAHAPGTIPGWIWPTLGIVMALLMVSTIPYPDLPKHVVRGLIPRWTLLPLVLVFAWRPRAALVAAWAAYAALPPMAAAVRRLSMRQRSAPDRTEAI